MKTAVLDWYGGMRRRAAFLISRAPALDRRHAVAVAASVPVIFLGPYAVPFMLSLLLLGAVVAIFVSRALRAGLRAWQAMVPMVAVLPFIGIFVPVEDLPNWMQILSHLFPLTYIVEGLRTLITFGAFDSAAFVASVLLSGMYFFFLSLWGEGRAAKGNYATLKTRY